MFILTDDQDIKLNSLDVQPKVKSLLINEGMFFNNAFVTTPVCCPSRYVMLQNQPYNQLHHSYYHAKIWCHIAGHQHWLASTHTIITLMRILLNEVVMLSHGVTRMRRRLLDTTWAWLDTRLDYLVSVCMHTQWSIQWLMCWHRKSLSVETTQA